MSARCVYPVLVSILLTLTSCGGGGGGATVGGVWQLNAGDDTVTVVIWESGGKIFGISDHYGYSVSGSRSGSELTFKVDSTYDSYSFKLTWDGANGMSGTYTYEIGNDAGDCSGSRQDASGSTAVWSLTDCNGNARTICVIDKGTYYEGAANDGSEVWGLASSGTQRLHIEELSGDTTILEFDLETGIGTMECDDGTEKSIDMKRLDKTEQQNVTNVNQGTFDGQVNGSFSGSCKNNYGSGHTSGTYKMDVNPGGTFTMVFKDPNGEEWVTVRGSWQSANNTYAMMNGSGSSDLVGTMTVKGTITLDAAKLGASGTFSSSGDYGVKCSGTF